MKQKIDMGKYHEILGVQPSATPEEIKIAYRKLAVELHPDKTGGDKKAEDRLKAINEAYTALKQGKSDPEPDFTSHQQWTGGAPDYIMQFMREAMDRMRGSAGSFGFTQQRVQVELKKFFEGGDVTTFVQKPIRRGNITLLVPESFTFKIQPDHPIDEAVMVTVDGQNVRVLLQPIPSEGVSIEGFIHTSELLEVSAFEAMVGGKLQSVLPSGKKVRVVIPKGVSSGSVIRLPGAGLNSKQLGRGDHLYHVVIVTPQLSEEHTKLVAEVIKKINAKS